ncbi:MAG TPA: PEP/pyruvate-binding domain-containing protein [Thermoanaerobaculia bacterium]|nr:PEP/pyruvate-binding domain-containing protein [Thermoanaerobaculia bacterium]
MATTPLQVVRLTQLDAVNVRQFGGKVSNLAQLTMAGVDVPPGVALGKEVLAHFLSENGINLPALEQLHNRGMIFLESALQEAQVWQARIVDTIHKGDLPSAISDALLENLDNPDRVFAVRSSCVVEDSASTSFAGQYVTVLAVSGREAILDAIRSCWASQYDGRVLTYAISRRGMPVLVPSMAVLVQEMLTPSFAGVCFTEGPTPRTKELMIIESVVGVGEALVSGERTPAHFELRQDGELHRAMVPADGKTPSEAQIASIAAEARKIAGFFGRPQDVEWALVDDRLFILQARPITVLGGERAATTLTLLGGRTEEVGRPATVETSSAVLRDDLHEWLISRVDPLVYRGCSYLLSKQQQDGSWKIEGHPEWDCVATALMVKLLIDGGVPGSLAWSLPRGDHESPVLGVQAAVAWLARNVGDDGGWGTDLWDSCQVLRALVRSSFSLDEPILAKAFSHVMDQLARGVTSVADQEWAGAGFVAVALQLLSESGRSPAVKDLVTLLLDTQTADGDFPALHASGDRVPSEWHTAQVITSLMQCCADDAHAATAASKALEWLLSRQHSDGSWGVSAGPYAHYNTFFTSYAVIALSSAGYSPATEQLARAVRWLRGKQVASGAFGDIASSLMAMTAFQVVYGPLFALELPLPLFLRVQHCLSTIDQLAH